MCTHCETYEYSKSCGYFCSDHAFEVNEKASDHEDIMYTCIKCGCCKTEERMTEAFMIENSWYLGSDGVYSDEGHANLKLYATEDDAKEALSMMAHGLGIILSEADTSFSDGDDTYFINRYEIEGT